MANGPRRGFTPLDRMLMDRASVQGGVMNFLGNQPEVTVPVRAQSHVDSPPVELAYITDAEKDLLVKANIHGSMAGKPNPGPAGIASLDDFFSTPGGGIGGGSTQDTGGSVGSGGSAEDFGVQPGQAVTRPDDRGKGGGNVIAPNPDGSGGVVTLTPEQVEVQKKFNVNVMTGQGGIGQTENQAIGFQNFADKLAVQAATGSGGGFNILNFLPGYNAANLIGKGFDAIFKNPKAEDFVTDNFRAILKGQVLFTDEQKKEYYERYKDEINKAGYGSLNAFKTALDEAEIPQGSEAQRRLDPESYYDKELFKELELPGMLEDQPAFLKALGLTPSSSRFATTSGNLANIAQIDASEKVFNPETGKMEFKYSDDFRRKIFDARAELDRMGKDMFGNTRSGPVDSPAFTQPGGPAQPPATPPPGGGQPPTTPPQQPGQPFFPFPSTGIASIFDPRFMGPSFDPRMSAYARQGRGAFDQFYRNLERFPVV